MEGKIVQNCRKYLLSSILNTFSNFQTNFILRIKEQETRLTLQEHDDE